MRPRYRQPSSPPTSLHYGLTTMFVAGLAFVDSFSLLANHHRPHQCQRAGGSSLSYSGRSHHRHHHHHQRQQKQEPHHVRNTSFGGQARNSCPVSPRSSIVGGPTSGLRGAASGDEARSSTRNIQFTSCVTARTRSSAAKKPGVQAASDGECCEGATDTTVNTGSSSSSSRRRRRREGGAYIEGDAEGSQNAALDQKQNLQRSIDRVGDRAMSRGQLVSSFALVGTAAALLGGSGTAGASSESAEKLDEILVWSPKSQILKRANGGRPVPGTNDTFPVRFVTYLARFLLNYDKASRELWDQMANNIPINFSTMEVEAVRKDQFAEFAKAVQVGLLDFQGPQGIRAFYSLMRSRYGQGEDCKRQLAILFSFLDENQPVEPMKKLLGEIDNGQINSIVLTDPGGGYTGDVPKVTISPSQAGERAKARAVLREIGHIVGFRLKDCGSSLAYKEPPRVRVSAPADPDGVQAEARAVLDKRQGFISAIEITNPGSGYSTALAPVTVEVFGSDVDETGDDLVSSVLGGEGETVCRSNFVAEAIIDREVAAIEILNHGDGYATSVPLVVEIQAPGDCEGRPGGTQAFAVGLVAAGIARDDTPNQLPVPDTSVTTQLAQVLPSTVSDTLTINEQGWYESLDLVDLPGTPGSGGSAARKGPVSSPMFDPVFGPIGRSPLEREAVLNVEDYLKLATAGAACNALVRFFLHPVDCVKTTVQAKMDVDPDGEEEGSGWVGTVKGIVKKGGIGELTRGIDVSTILGFFLGFIGFGGTELFRRELTRMMEMMPGGSNNNTVWVILLASALAQLVSVFVTCPLEAVRIRVMTCDRRPEFLSFIGKTQEMLDQEGLLYLWSGVPALLFRELPFAIAKFLTFEIVRDRIFQEVPAAQESVFYALVVSITAGMTAGVAGAIVSNPADTILTRINTVQKAPKTTVAATAAAVPSRQPRGLRQSFAGVGASSPQSSSSASSPSSTLGSGGSSGGDLFGGRTRAGLELMEIPKSDLAVGEAPDWKEVVRDMIEGEEGFLGLFSGLGLRACFFGAAIALQFFAFDYFKALLQVSPDDIQLVLDVFADRVSFYSGGGANLF